MAMAAEIDAGAPKGAVQTAKVERKADAYKFPIARFDGSEVPLVTVEGRTKWAAMKIDDAETADVLDWYRDSLTQKGFEIILDCTGRACGGFDFRFGAEVLPPPAMQIDVADFGQISLIRSQPAGVVSILVSRVRGVAYVQTVSVTPSSGVVSLEPDPVGAATPPTETRAAPEAEQQDESAAQTPYERLISRGHLVVTGVEFATGGAKIALASGPALDRVAVMLQQHGDLRIAIVGHSDNQGGLNANIALSQRRAQAVMRALIERGIASERLEARGIGYLAPLKSNTTKEGRAVNRRVELVVR